MVIKIKTDLEEFHKIIGLANEQIQRTDELNLGCERVDLSVILLKAQTAFRLMNEVEAEMDHFLRKIEEEEIRKDKINPTDIPFYQFESWSEYRFQGGDMSLDEYVEAVFPGEDG